MKTSFHHASNSRSVMIRNLSSNPPNRSEWHEKQTPSALMLSRAPGRPQGHVTRTLHGLTQSKKNNKNRGSNNKINGCNQHTISSPFLSSILPPSSPFATANAWPAKTMRHKATNCNHPLTLHNHTLLGLYLFWIWFQCQLLARTQPVQPEHNTLILQRFI